MALRVAAAALVLVAVGCIALSIIGMVTGRPDDRSGFALRLAALVCFACAVLLNVLAH